MILVEAAGVELITMLTTRKLLILGSATRAKKAPLPDPLYVYCTKMLSRCGRSDVVTARVSHNLAFFQNRTAAYLVSGLLWAR
jgi:hypothetical protein